MSAVDNPHFPKGLLPPDKEEEVVEFSDAIAEVLRGLAGETVAVRMAVAGIIVGVGIDVCVGEGMTREQIVDGCGKLYDVAVEQRRKAGAS